MYDFIELLFLEKKIPMAAKAKDVNIKNINVKLLGKHNVLNAAAAFIVCMNLGADQKIAKKSLKTGLGLFKNLPSSLH